MHSYPKVYALGHAAIGGLLLDAVIVQEKLDGSQFSFTLGPKGTDGGHDVVCKSRNKIIDQEAAGMFHLAVEHVKSVAPRLTEGYTYRCEYLMKNKHNTLTYARVPKNNLVLFDVNTGHELYMHWKDVELQAKTLDIDCVPTLQTGRIENPGRIKELLGDESFLGGPAMEGIVIKNYGRFGRDGHVLMGKYVSEDFKEMHTKDWKKRHPGGKDVLAEIGMSLCTQARWRKALQHLKERGEYTQSLRDIGALFKEVNQDTQQECAEEIKEVLFKWGWKGISKHITRGLPEWYKEYLMEVQFEDTTEVVDDKPGVESDLPGVAR